GLVVRDEVSVGGARVGVSARMAAMGATGRVDGVANVIGERAALRPLCASRYRVPWHVVTARVVRARSGEMTRAQQVRAVVGEVAGGWHPRTSRVSPGWGLGRHVP